MSQASTSRWSASHVPKLRVTSASLPHITCISLHRSHVLAANDAAVRPPESDSRNYLTTLTFHSSLPGSNTTWRCHPDPSHEQMFPCPGNHRTFFSFRVNVRRIFWKESAHSHTHTHRWGFWFGWILHDAMSLSRVVGQVSETTSENCLYAEPNLAFSPISHNKEFFGGVATHVLN
jgi:hypothetical protein